MPDWQHRPAEHAGSACRRRPCEGFAHWTWLRLRLPGGCKTADAGKCGLAAQGSFVAWCLNCRAYSAAARERPHATLQEGSIGSIPCSPGHTANFDGRLQFQQVWLTHEDLLGREAKLPDLHLRKLHLRHEARIMRNALSSGAGDCGVRATSTQAPASQAHLRVCRASLHLLPWPPIPHVQQPVNDVIQGGFLHGCTPGRVSRRCGRVPSPLAERRSSQPH